MNNDLYEVIKRDKPLNITVSVPGSKSITNRALLLAALSTGKTTCHGVLFSEDTEVFMEALRKLGYRLVVRRNENKVVVFGHGIKLPKDNIEIYVGSAGTAARFLTAMLALSGGTYTLDASMQMRKRPMKELLKALEQLGVVFEYKEQEYAFPFVIKGRKKSAMEKVELNMDESSQYLSALLMSSIFCQDGLQINLVGKRKAKSYVDITLRMMEQFGVIGRQLSETSYFVACHQNYRCEDYFIEPDVSAACYFYAMAAVTKGSALVKGVYKDGMQGDLKFIKALEDIGCTCRETRDGIRISVKKNGELLAIDINMSDFSDQAMTLAAIAPMLKGTTKISGIAHARKQESDRVHAMATELSARGIDVEELPDGLIIQEGKVLPGVVHTYEDHRMAMAFAVMGLYSEGISIENPDCCAKTFKEYFKLFTAIDKS